MQTFELDYHLLILDVMQNGEDRSTRNGMTRSMFAKTLEVDLTDTDKFPLLQSRKMFVSGVLGEFAAFVRKPKHLADFEEWGCNYWKDWAKPDGSITVDYGNAWFDDNQIDRLRYKLANDPTDRRMIVTGWRPERLEDLDLPCCHMMYQFYVNAEGYLSMIWTQRSVDMMIGLPADIILAATWLITLANEFGFKPGKITMNFGDCHIYAEHFKNVERYLANEADGYSYPVYELKTPTGTPFDLFEPKDLRITDYESHGHIPFELKA